MKILYDKDGFEILDEYSYIYKRDVFRRGRLYSKFILKCSVCGEPFFARLKSTRLYCSKDCACKSEVVRAKLSKAGKGRKLSDKQKRFLSRLHSKGGVTKKNIPLYDTFVDKLKPVEEVKNKDGFLYVRCSFCNEWFLPKRTAVDARVQYIKGNSDRESRFYCSEACKMKCPVFHKKKWPNGNNPRKSRNNKLVTESELRTWSKEVLARAGYICERCGEKACLSHHINPKKLNIGEALDPDNGIALCSKCHLELHKDECSFTNLANTQCST